MAAKNEVNASSAAPFLIEDGAHLALQMLREMRGDRSRHASEPFMIEAAYRRAGERQRNIVQEYVDRIRANGDSNLERGFTCMLTEYLASCLSGGVPDLEIYDEIIETETLG